MARTHSKLSKAVQNQLAAIDGRTVVVAAVRTVTKADLPSFAGFNLSEAEGSLIAGEPVLLPRTSGLFAARNIDGWVEKQKDLPKELREIWPWAISSLWRVTRPAACPKAGVSGALRP